MLGAEVDKALAWRVEKQPSNSIPILVIDGDKPDRLAVVGFKDRNEGAAAAR